MTGDVIRTLVCVLAENRYEWIVRSVTGQSLGSADDYVVFTVDGENCCEMDLRCWL